MIDDVHPARESPAASLSHSERRLLCGREELRHNQRRTATASPRYRSFGRFQIGANGRCPGFAPSGEFHCPTVPLVASKIGSSAFLRASPLAPDAPGQSRGALALLLSMMNHGSHGRQLALEMCHGTAARCGGGSDGLLSASRRRPGAGTNTDAYLALHPLGLFAPARGLSRQDGQVENAADLPLTPS
jgi:hypothetical protein